VRLPIGYELTEEGQPRAAGALTACVGRRRPFVR